MSNSLFYVLGVGLIIVGGVCLSSGGILIRYVQDADAWTILFYRSVAFSSMLFGVVLFRHRLNTPRAFLAVGKNGVILAFALGGGFICYVFAMLLTSVASVAFIISAAPFFAGLLGWLFLRERVQLMTWFLIVGAMLGMALIFADGLVAGNILGTIISLGLPISFAIMLVMIRRAGDIDMLPATCLAGVVAAIIGAIMCDTLTISTSDLILTITLGVGQLGLGFMLITLGVRYVPAAESALLSLSETVLAPIWAWLFLAEIPLPLAIFGGLVVVICVAIQGAVGVWQERREDKQS